MNKFIIAVLILFLCGAVHAEFTPIEEIKYIQYDPKYPYWKKVTETEKRSVFLYSDVRTLHIPSAKSDDESLMRSIFDSGFKAMWIKLNYKAGHYKDHKSKKNIVAKRMFRVVFHCDAQTYGYTTMSIYDEDDEKLGIENTKLKNVFFKDVNPDTHMHAWSEHACEERKKKGGK